MDVYLGTIMPWSIPFAPRGWNFCDGTLLQIQQYTALYALIGTTYGGDGQVTFALPDLRGRSPIGTGQSSFGTILRGTTVGVENQTISLGSANLPPHTHALEMQPVSIGERSISIEYYGTSDYGTSDVPQNGSYLGAATAVSGRTSNMYRGALDNPVELSGVSGVAPEVDTDIVGNLSSTGNGQSFNVSRVQPSLGMNYIIAVQGIFPPRP